MKRGGPLRRTGGLARRTELVGGKPLRQRSTKAARQQRERTELVKRMAGHTGRMLCTFPLGCGAEADDTDERVNRSQLSGAAVDESLFQPLCRRHHDWKHQHPDEAEALGIYVRGSTYRRSHNMPR